MHEKWNSRIAHIGTFKPDGSTTPGRISQRLLFVDNAGQLTLFDSIKRNGEEGMKKQALGLINLLYTRFSKCRNSVTDMKVLKLGLSALPNCLS